MLRLDSYKSLPWEKKADNRYWTHITLGEVGTPLKYYSRGDDGKVIERTEVVSEEGLFNDNSVKSLPGLPIVLLHPTKKAYNLNREGLRVGTILSAIAREDSKLIAEAIIDDYRGVELIDKLLSERKAPEASSGYHLVDLRAREDGTLEQIRGVYDHVAAPLMPGRARGGKNIVLRFDDAISDRQFFDFGGITKTVRNLVVRLDTEGEDLVIQDPAPEVERAIKFYQGQIKTLTTDLEGVEERLDELQQECEQLKADKKEREDTVETEKAPNVSISEEIKLRMDTWEQVRGLVPDIKPDWTLCESEIMVAGIKAIKPDLNLDGKDESVVKGIWEGIQLAKSVEAPRQQTREQRQTDRFLEKQSQRQDSQESGKSAIALAYENAYKERRRK